MIYGRGTNALGGDYAVAFEHGIELVGRQGAEGFGFSRRPVNFHTVDFFGLAKPEVHSQIVL
jgi:hypothetical protein